MLERVNEQEGDERQERSQEEADVLAEGLRQIVTSRERTPRSPAWDAAWKRTLWRFSRRLRRLRRNESPE